MDRPALDVSALRSALDARWARVDVVDETRSTNADLLSATDAADRTLLAAEYQSAGRGRFDRVWSSPARVGITASFLLRPGAPIATWGWLPLLTGVAVAEGLEATAGVRAKLKWPNDVLLGSESDADSAAKLAGILAQSSEGCVVIGIGCNVSTAAGELPPGVDATSLALAGADVDRTALLIAVAQRLDARAAQWDDCGGDAAACGLAEAYRGRCDTIGREVRVVIGDETVTGTASDVDEQGHLVLVPADGAAARPITAGDVVHVRRSR